MYHISGMYVEADECCYYCNGDVSAPNLRVTCSSGCTFVRLQQCDFNIATWHCNDHCRASGAKYVTKQGRSVCKPQSNNLAFYDPSMHIFKLVVGKDNDQIKMIKNGLIDGLLLRTRIFEGNCLVFFL